jgi:hypothetical protein
MRKVSVVCSYFPGYICLTAVTSLGKGARNIWNQKLSGFGGQAIDKQKFIQLHGDGKKLCRLVAGGTLICFSYLNCDLSYSQPIYSHPSYYPPDCVFWVEVQSQGYDSY